MRAPHPNSVDDASGPDARRVYRAELFVFLLVLLPWMGFTLVGASPRSLSFALVAAVIIFHDLALTALVLYFVWRNGEGTGAIGWNRRGIGREVFLGVALFVPLFVGVALLEALLQAVGLAEPVKPPAYLLPRGGGEYAFALVLLATVAVAEETVFRGYLLRRFMQVGGSRALAIVLSTTIFALGHAYQGALGIVAVAAIGAAFAVIYLWRGSLVAPMVMHFIQNFIGLIVAPQLAG